MILDYLTKWPLSLKVNRPITQEEIRLYLNPDLPHLLGAFDYLSVIEINSSYLEIADSYYHTGGVLSLIGFLNLLLSACSLASLCLTIHFDVSLAIYDWQILVLLFVFALFVFFAIIFLKAELRNRTYNPIRFYREDRMVYRLRADGTVLVKPWGEIFFHAGSWSDAKQDRYSRTLCVLRGHVLADGTGTVKETFPIGVEGPFEADRLFEFIRRYMDEEIDRLPTVYRCIPIDGFGKTVVWYYYMQLLKRHCIDSIILCFSWDISIAMSRWLINRFQPEPVWPLEYKAVSNDSTENRFWVRNASQDSQIKWRQLAKEYRAYYQSKYDAIDRSHEEVVSRLEAMREKTNDQEKIEKLNNLIRIRNEMSSVSIENVKI